MNAPSERPTPDSFDDDDAPTHKRQIRGTALEALREQRTDPRPKQPADAGLKRAV